MNGAIPSPEALAGLEAQVLALLTTHPAGLSEHELLKILRAEHLLFADFSAREPLSLFRGHFLLFHVLYRARDRLARERRGRLQIDPLRIVLVAEQSDEPMSAEAQLSLREPDMSAWYADLQRLATVTATDVIELLRQFRAARTAHEQRQAALAVLGLQDPVNATVIKRQYRRLAMRHHPDRGGDERRLCAIHAALAVLKNGERRR